MIEITVRVPDPVAAKLIQRIAERSCAGKREYGHDSILDQQRTEAELVSEIVEEAADMALWSEGLLARLVAPRSGLDAA